MDWKNKKAAKQGVHDPVLTSAGMPSSPSGSGYPALSANQPPSQVSPARSAGRQEAPASQAGPSGLSSMFGRTATSEAPSSSIDSVEQAYRSEQSVTGIAMSPMGLPLPADLPIPSTSSSAYKAGGENGPPGMRPKPLSYASALSTSSQNSAQPGTSPSGFSSRANPARSGIASGINSSDAIASSPTAASLLGQSGPRTTLASSSNPHQASYLSRLSASVPSYGLDTSTGTASSQDPSVPNGLELAYQQSQHSPFGPHSFQTAHVHRPSPLAPTLTHSQSLNNQALPTLSNPYSSYSSLSLGRPPVSPPGLSHSGAPAPPSNIRTTSATNVFGTSPFGSNAIFLSSSHEDHEGDFGGRGRRAGGFAGSYSGRESSPMRFDRESGVSSSVTRGRSSLGMSGRLEQDEQEESEDVLEEELVPSSLKHLLTPNEKMRRASRSSGQAKSGFFNPFDDDEDEAEAAAEAAEAERDLQQRYSRSVPATRAHLYSGLTNASKAMGSPPVLSEFSANAMSFTPRDLPYSVGQAPSNGASAGGSSNLARHLLSGASGSPVSSVMNGALPRIEHGLYSPNGETRPVSTAGTSLPQGLAAGLSRLHLIPAGVEHTGYTPPASLYAQSPPVGTPSITHNSSGPAAHASGSFGTSPSASAGLLQPGRPGSAQLAQSYGMKLPSLLHSSSLTRRTSNNLVSSPSGAEPHVGSPLARPREADDFTELEARPHEDPRRKTQEKKADGSRGDHQHHGSEEDELVFDMDV